MKSSNTLSKAIIDKLSPAEAKKLKSLQEKWQKMYNEMIKAQSAYSMAFRKDSSDKNLLKLADKGFKYEKLTFEARDNLNKYMDLLKKNKK